MREEEMEKFFNPTSIAIIGASRDHHKVGFVILKNLRDAGYKGKIFPINPKARIILNEKCYPSVLQVKEAIDLAVIAVPAEIALNAVEECGKKKIKAVVMITAGFSEIGNSKAEEQIKRTIEKHRMRLIGPNCLGLLNNHANIDTLFLPASRLVRPKDGKISFITQSGATGSTVLDLMAKENYGFAKFISYGNAADINEADLVEYLGNDPLTQVICLYAESIKQGKRFLRVAHKVTKKKPVIVLKGGTTNAGAKAALSHTASLAGSYEVFKGAMKQAGVIVAENLEDLFNYAKVLEKSFPPKGNKVQIITNGGGFGILATDHLSKLGLSLEEPSAETVKKLRKQFPPTYIVKNPIDLTGSARSEDYDKALDAVMKDKKSDIILLIILYQTPELDTNVVGTVIKYNKLKKKPILVISMGGDFTQKYKNILEKHQVPCFTYPNNAATAIKVLTEYHQQKN